jgi:uncharacterized protein
MAELDARGWVIIQGLSSAAECRALAAAYEDDKLFRSRIVMARDGFGRGEYKNFCYPLPDLVARLREALYPQLARIANCWNDVQELAVQYPARHSDFIKRCHDAGQVRPTPTLVKFGPHDYYSLHDEMDDEHCFPLQVAILLGEPQADFIGGELTFAEQRPRAQCRVDVAPLRRGDAVVFAVCERPVKGVRGSHRASMRYGVSEIRSGHRHSLKIIFNDSV